MSQEINQIIMNEIRGQVKVASMKNKLEEIFRFERENADQQSPRFKERYREIIEADN
ncbi:MAG: hypothetical protein ISS45_08085 [Candidatus Omnitrophica bacterium]|nr:hypothetical protein [Candidatus Omnitrophota bacterium]